MVDSGAAQGNLSLMIWLLYICTHVSMWSLGMDGKPIAFKPDSERR